MQFFKDTWNNYRAYRRLQGLWFEVNQLTLQDESEVEAYEKKFLEFLECFNRIANDQIAQLEEEKQYREMVDSISGKHPKNLDDPETFEEFDDMSSGSEKAEGSSEKKKELEENTHWLVKFFKDIPQVQQKIFDYLAYRVREYDKFLQSQSHLIGQSIFIRPSMPIKKYQIQLFQKCLEAFKMIIKDHGDISEFENLDKLFDALISQFRVISDAQSMKSLLILIQSIFQNGEKHEMGNIRLKFANKQGFHEALKQLLLGDIEYRRYIRAFFRQNLTYQTQKSVLMGQKSKKDHFITNESGSISQIQDGDDSDEILLEEEIQDRVFAKLKKFVTEKFQNIKPEFIEDFLYSQDATLYIRQDSYLQDDQFEFESNSNHISMNQHSGNDLLSDDDSEIINSQQDFRQIQPGSLPTKSNLLALANLCSDQASANLTTSSTGRRTSSAGQGTNLILKAPREFQQVLNHKKQIDNLNKILREKKIFDAFTSLIGQSTLDSLFHFIAVLQFMVNHDIHNQVSAKEAGIFGAITNSFKRLIKYGQQQDINQAIVLKSFQSLLKMSIGNVSLKQNTIKNFDALFCSLTCVKILLKSKSNNNYSDAVKSLSKIMTENGPENSIMFNNRGGFSYIKEWIESLILDSSNDLHLHQQSLQYLSKIFELSGIILFNIGDLDQMPFANEIVEILITNQGNNDFSIAKRELLINFLLSVIDDKNVRLDLKRPQVKFVFEDIQILTKKSLSLFEIYQYRDRKPNLNTFIQDTKLLLKLCKYQIDQNDRNARNTELTIFGTDFNVQEFINRILQIYPHQDEYYAQMVYLASQILTAQQLVDPKSSSETFEKTLKKISFDFKETFACLYMSPKYNKQCVQIKNLLNQNSNIIQRTYEQFVLNMRQMRLDECLMSLHLLVILSKDSQSAVDALEGQINFDDLTSLLLKQDFNADDQLFILRCILQLCSEQNESSQRTSEAYLNALDSCFIYMNHGCQNSNAYAIFESLFTQVHQMKTFIQRFGHSALLNNSQVYQQSKIFNRVQDFFMDEEAINENVILRKSQFLNVFMIFMLNSQAQVQIKTFEDLQYILFLNSQNKRVFVNFGFQEFLLQVIYKLSHQYKLPQTTENQQYVEGLVMVVQRLLEYGVDLKSTSTMIQRIIMSITLINNDKSLNGRQGSNKNKHVNVSHIFTQAVINILQDSQVSKFSQFDAYHEFNTKIKGESETLRLQMKIEGDVKDQILKLMTIKLSNKNQYTLWLDRNRLCLKQNHNFTIKSMSVNMLKTNSEFNLSSYNVFEISHLGQNLTIDINETPFVHVKMPKNEFIQDQDMGKSAKRQMQGRKNAKSFFVNFNPFQGRENEVLNEGEISVCIQNRILMSNEGSYLFDRETNLKTPVIDTYDLIDSPTKKRDSKSGKLQILKSHMPQQELLSGISRNNSSQVSVSEKHSSKLQAHMITIPLNLKLMVAPNYFVNQQNLYGANQGSFQQFGAHGQSEQMSQSRINPLKSSPRLDETTKGAQHQINDMISQMSIPSRSVDVSKLNQNENQVQKTTVPDKAADDSSINKSDDANPRRQNTPQFGDVSPVREVVNASAPAEGATDKRPTNSNLQHLNSFFFSPMRQNQTLQQRVGQLKGPQFQTQVDLGQLRVNSINEQHQMIGMHYGSLPSINNDPAFLLDEGNRMIFEVRIKNASSSENSSKSTSPMAATEINPSKHTSIKNSYDVQTLKQYLCQSKSKCEETLRILLQLLDQCQDSQTFIKSNVSNEAQQGVNKESPLNENMDLTDNIDEISDDQKFTLALTLFTSLIIKNESIIATFLEMGGLLKLQGILEAKLQQQPNEQTIEVLYFKLIQIVCDDYRAVYHLRQLHSNPKSDSQSSRSSEKDLLMPAKKEIVIPQIQEDKVQFLKMAIILTTSIQNSNKNISIFLEQLVTLFSSSTLNINIFREHVGFKEAILQHIFKKMVLSKTNKYSPIYEISLKLFEVCIETIKNHQEFEGQPVDDNLSGDEAFLQDFCDNIVVQNNINLKNNPLNELQAIFDFVIDQDYQVSNSNSSELCETTVKVAIDILTIVFIHIIVSNKKCDRRQQLGMMNEDCNQLLTKLLKLDTFNLIMSLIAIDNLQLREHSIKILQLLIFVSPEFEEDFRSKQGFKIIGKILKAQHNVSSFNQSHTILNTILQTYDNPNDIRPVSNALVQQVMNKSRIASDIVSQTNIALNKPKKTLLVYYDIFEFFFESVSLLDSDNSRCQIFKVLQQYFCDQHNDQQIAEAAETNFKNILSDQFQGMIIELYKYIQSQNFTVNDLMSQIVYQIMNGNSNNSNDELDDDDEDADDFNNEQYFDPAEATESASPFPFQLDQLNEQYAGLQMTFKRKNKSVEIAIDLIIKIVIQDLKREPTATKTFKFLRDFDSSAFYNTKSITDKSQQNEEEKNFLQLQIIIKLLNYFLKNPKVQQEYGDGSILINLNNILQNLDQLVPQNPLIILKSLQLINLMAFKNMMEVRRQMKHLKMFELRDKLLIMHLQNISEILLQSESDGYSYMQEPAFVQNNDTAKCLLMSISEFSYDVVASKAIFRDNQCLEILVLTLIQNIKKLSDQELSAVEHKFQTDLTYIIQKEILQYPENQSSFAKNLPNLYKLFQQKQDESLLKTLRQKYCDYNNVMDVIPVAQKVILSQNLAKMKKQYQEMSRRRDEEYRRLSHQQLSQDAVDFKDQMECFKLNLIKYKFQNKKRIEAWNNY